MSDRQPAIEAPRWRLDRLTPVRCRLVLAVFLVASAAANVAYLNNRCPIDLGGDEAQYWDWSRHLDLSYYSKGPLIAYIIRGSCALFGDTMPAVRYPAIACGTLTSVITYLLTKKLFQSERLALGAALLFTIVPIFILGNMLMTIDPPMLLCWALACLFSAHALFSRRAAAWVGVGLAVGVGFLAKYAEALWFVGIFGFLLASRRPRRDWMGASLALVIAAACATPVILWNRRHDWVSLRHVARQTGVSVSSFEISNVFEMIGGQIAAVGPTIAVLMIVAIVTARRHEEADRPRRRFLIWLGLPFFALNLVASLRAKVQPNWPAPAYFTLIILTAWFLSDRLKSAATWKPWRGWFWASAIVGIAVWPIAHNTAVIYPLLKPFLKARAPAGTEQIDPAMTTAPAATAIDEQAEMEQIDPTARLRGWAELGARVDQLRATLPPDAFILCDDYQQTAEMAFYGHDHPTTYCAGSYFGKRLSQYDLWTDHRLDVTSPLVGRDAIYLGKGGGLPARVCGGFTQVEALPPLRIIIRGQLVRTFKLWRCSGFHGFPPLAEMPGKTY